jgi:hypothetical protein
MLPTFCPLYRIQMVDVHVVKWTVLKVGTILFVSNCNIRIWNFLCGGEDLGSKIAYDAKYHCADLASVMIYCSCEFLSYYFLKRIDFLVCEISSSHGGEYDDQNYLLGCTAV